MSVGLLLETRRETNDAMEWKKTTNDQMNGMKKALDECIGYSQCRWEDPYSNI